MSGNASDADTSWISALIEFFYGIAMREVLRRIRSLKHGGYLILFRIIKNDRIQWFNQYSILVNKN